MFYWTAAAVVQKKPQAPCSLKNCCNVRYVNDFCPEAVSRELSRPSAISWCATLATPCLKVTPNGPAPADCDLTAKARPASTPRAP